MGVIEIISGVLLLIVCALIIIVVAMQETKGGLGAVGGETGSYFDKNRGQTKEAMLARASRIGGGALFVLTCIVLAVEKFL